MMYNFWYLVALFFMYSVTGWIIEEVDIIIHKKEFANRGFLLGTYCPIYGVGSILMILYLDKYIKDPLIIFVMCVFICGILEYFTSYIMEKIFKTRWWDYSNYKFNINGRICLETLAMFGVGGIIVMYIGNPAFLFVLNHIPSILIKILDIIMMTIFIIDFCISVKVIYRFKNATECLKKDSTREMNIKVIETITKESKLVKRLINAFPNFKHTILKYKGSHNEKLSKNSRTNN